MLMLPAAMVLSFVARSIYRREWISNPLFCLFFLVALQQFMLSFGALLRPMIIPFKEISPCRACRAVAGLQHDLLIRASFLYLLCKLQPPLTFTATLISTRLSCKVEDQAVFWWDSSDSLSLRRQLSCVEGC